MDQQSTRQFVNETRLRDALAAGHYLQRQEAHRADREPAAVWRGLCRILWRSSCRCHRRERQTRSAGEGPAAFEENRRKTAADRPRGSALRRGRVDCSTLDFAVRWCTERFYSENTAIFPSFLSMCGLVFVGMRRVAMQVWPTEGAEVSLSPSPAGATIRILEFPGDASKRHGSVFGEKVALVNCNQETQRKESAK